MVNSILKIGAVIPLSGVAGLFGPSCCNCIRLGIRDINRRGGIGGRSVEAVFIDGGQRPADVAKNVSTLLQLKAVDALIGMHDSDVRTAILDLDDLAIPYIYTPTYEGGETAPAVFMLGETPRQQLKPVIPWLMAEKQVGRWYLIGNDYSWPRKLNGLARCFIREEGGEIAGEHYAAFGTEDFSPFLEDIRQSDANAVLVALVGADSVAFNRDFAEAGLAERALRFGPLVEENTLLAMGANAGAGLYTASAYLAAIEREENQAFLAEYNALFGADAPVVTSLAQSCYEAVVFLEKLVGKAGSLEPAALEKASEGLTYQGVRGAVTMTGRHLVQSIHLAKVDGFEFQIVADFDSVSP